MLITALAAILATPVNAAIVISQVYGGGNGSGATYRNDFVELHNNGDRRVDLNGLSLQYGSATGVANFNEAMVSLNGLIEPGGYFLVQLAGGTTNGIALPTADQSSTAINLASGSGKIVLVNSANGLYCNGGTASNEPCDATQLNLILDAVGYGTADYFEGTTAIAALSNTQAAFRNNNGCTDTNQNSADFTRATPAPRNRVSPANVCAGVTVVPQVGITAGASLAEGNSPGCSTQSLNFTLNSTVPAPSGGYVIGYTISSVLGNTASAGSDFIEVLNGSATIVQGASTVGISATTVCDLVAEANETFTVAINTPPVGVELAPNASALGIIRNDDTFPSVEIFQIQGSGFATADLYADNLVVTADNVVTAVGTTGFAMQTPDARADGNLATSDGIWVFTGGAPGVAVGNVVTVTGRTVEFFGLTEISATGGGSVVVTASGASLPTPIEFSDASGRPSKNPLSLSCPSSGSGGPNNIDTNFECFEMMRVSIPSGTTTQGNQRFTGDLFAEVFVTARDERSHRDGGMRPFGALTPGDNTGAGFWDGNPEIFEMDADRFGAVPNPTAIAGGATFSATGILSFDFGDYVFLPTHLTFTGAYTANSNPLPRSVTTPATATELRIGSYNMWRFCDSDFSPGTSQSTDPCYSGGVHNATALQQKVDRISAYIIQVLKSPDVIGVQEVENITVLQQLATQIATAGGPSYQAHLFEGNDIGGIDVGFLVNSATVNNVTVTQLNKLEKWSDPACAPTPDCANLHDRPSILLTANFSAAVGGSFPFAVINNHTRSRGDVDPFNDGSDGSGSARVREKRFRQAQSIAREVQTYQTTNPTVPLILVGDFNSYEVTDAFVHTVSLIAGTYDASANLYDPGEYNASTYSYTPVIPPLQEIAPTLPEWRRYSYRFSEDFGAILGYTGNSNARDLPFVQVLDHALLGVAAQTYYLDMEYGRTNVDAPEDAFNGANSGYSAGNPVGTPIASSDHDGFVLRLESNCLANATLNIDGDGFCNALDNCPAIANTDQADGDSDNVGNVCDNCAAIANVDQIDGDGDTIGDACDACPFDPNNLCLIDEVFKNGFE